MRVQPREARLILQQIRMWEAEGLITVEQARTLSARYESLAGAQETKPTHPGVVILQALGGLVLGAAVIAFTVFLDVEEDAMAWVFTAIGLPLLAAGLYSATRGFELGDTGTVAALVPLTFTAVQADANALFFAIPLFAPLVATGLRVDATPIPPLAAIAFATASGIAIGALDWEFSLWIGLLILAAVGSLLPDRLRAKGTWHAATALLVVAIAVAAAVTYFNADLDWGQGGAELFVALFMGAALAGGILLPHKGLILGAAMALAVDAIVFAFDVGGLIGGTVTLLLVAGALIAFATTTAKRIMR